MNEKTTWFLFYFTMNRIFMWNNKLHVRRTEGHVSTHTLKLSHFVMLGFARCSHELLGGKTSLLLCSLWRKVIWKRLVNWSMLLTEIKGKPKPFWSLYYVHGKNVLYHLYRENALQVIFPICMITISFE